MRLVFKYTIDTYVGISNFLLIWCLTRETLRRRKLLRHYGCGLDLTDCHVFFKTKHPKKLRVHMDNAIFMEAASPKKILKKLTEIPSDKTLVVFHPQPILQDDLRSWIFNPHFPNKAEINILKSMMKDEIVEPKIDVIHVRCGDTISFNFLGDHEDTYITAEVLEKICRKLHAKYSHYTLITDCKQLACMAKTTHNIEVQTQQRFHSAFLKKDATLDHDIRILLRSKSVLNVNMYHQPSCLSLLFSKISNAKFENISIKEFIGSS